MTKTKIVVIMEDILLYIIIIRIYNSMVEWNQCISHCYKNLSPFQFVIRQLCLIITSIILIPEYVNLKVIFLFGKLKNVRQLNPAIKSPDTISVNAFLSVIPTEFSAQDSSLLKKN